MKQTFEDYLESQYMEEYPTTLDDELPDETSDWIGNLDGQEIMDYAEEWGEKRYLQGKKDMADEVKPDVEKLGNVLGGVDFTKDLEALKNL